MAPSTSILWIGTLLLLLQLGFNAGISEGASPSKKGKEVFVEKTDHEDSSDEMVTINLPLIVDMTIQLRFALNWRKDYPLCGKKESELLNKCGLPDLMKSIQVKQTNKQNAKQDMEKAFKTLCSAYGQFMSCAEEHRLPKCKSNDRFIIEWLLPYLCGSGRQILLKSDTGKCLSTVSAASIDDILTHQADCENSVSKWNSVVQMLLSKMNKSLSFDEAAIKEHLQALCTQWNNLHKCILPAYAKVCSQTVETFYIKLLNLIKEGVEESLVTYGKEVRQLAACKQVGKQVLSETTTTAPSMASEFAHFTKGQIKDWTSSTDRSVAVHGTCHLLTSYYRIISCFWKSAYDISPKIEQITQSIDILDKELCPISKTFSTCYDDSMSSCPPNVKVNYRNLTEQLCKVMESEAVNYNAIRTVLQHCGYTLSYLTVHFWSQSARMYISMFFTCSDRFSFFDVDFECLYKESEATSNLEAVKQAQSLIRLTEEVVMEYTAYLNKLKPYFCQ